jgi:hypothetical protein
LPAAAKPPKPDPNAPNPEPSPAVAKGEAPPAAANPVVGGFSGSVASAGFLKTDGVEVPIEPKGDCSEPAKEAKLDDAKAEAEVDASFVGSSPLDAGFGDPRAPNGDTAEVFANALVTGGCRSSSQYRYPKIDNLQANL